MEIIYSSLPEAMRAAEILQGIQKRYIAGLMALVGDEPISTKWFRNEGECGGGESGFRFWRIRPWQDLLLIFRRFIIEVIRRFDWL